MSVHKTKSCFYGLIHRGGFFARKALSIMLTMACVIGLFPGPLVSNALPGVLPTVTAKLNETVISDLMTANPVNNGDHLEVKVGFSEVKSGESYIIDLPNVFVTLNQATIEAGNAPIMPFVDVKITRNSDGTQRITIEFTQDVYAASFVFGKDLCLIGNIDGFKTYSIVFQ